MKRLEFFLSLVIILTALASQQARADAVFPGGAWSTLSRKAAGLDIKKMVKVRHYFEDLGTTAFMVVINGSVVEKQGAIGKRVNLEGLSQVLLSAISGIARANGRLHLGQTLGQTGIDDVPALSATEKSATVRDLLTCSSGVYRDAAGETAREVRRRPVPGSHAPGTFWAYSTWDYNALSAVLQKQLGMSVFQAFENDIARPLEMHDYRVKANRWVGGQGTLMKAPRFYLSAQDLARFGLLYLHAGNWRGQQVVPADWVGQSLNEAFKLPNALGFGFGWWISHDTAFDNDFGSLAFFAHNRGQYLLVVPSLKLVVVQLTNPDRHEPVITPGQFGTLVRLVLESRT